MLYFCAGCGKFIERLFDGIQARCNECGCIAQIQTPYLPDVLEDAVAEIPRVMDLFDSYPVEVQQCLLYLISSKILAGIGHTATLKFGRSRYSEDATCSRCSKVSTDVTRFEIRDRWQNTMNVAHLCQECTTKGLYEANIDLQQNNEDVRVGIG